MPSIHITEGSNLSSLNDLRQRTFQNFEQLKERLIALDKYAWDPEAKGSALEEQVIEIIIDTRNNGRQQLEVFQKEIAALDEQILKESSDSNSLAQVDERSLEEKEVGELDQQIDRCFDLQEEEMLSLLEEDPQGQSEDVAIKIARELKGQFEADVRKETLEDERQRQSEDVATKAALENDITKTILEEDRKDQTETEVQETRKKDSQEQAENDAAEAILAEAFELEAKETIQRQKDENLEHEIELEISKREREKEEKATQTLLEETATFALLEDEAIQASLEEEATLALLEDDAIQASLKEAIPAVLEVDKGAEQEIAEVPLPYVYLSSSSQNSSDTYSGVEFFDLFVKDAEGNWKLRKEELETALQKTNTGPEPDFRKEAAKPLQLQSRVPGQTVNTQQFIDLYAVLMSSNKWSRRVDVIFNYEETSPLRTINKSSSEVLEAMLQELFLQPCWVHDPNEICLDFLIRNVDIKIPSQKIDWNNRKVFLQVRRPNLINRAYAGIELAMSKIFSKSPASEEVVELPALGDVDGLATFIKLSVNTLVSKSLASEGVEKLEALRKDYGLVKFYESLLTDQPLVLEMSNWGMQSDRLTYLNILALAKFFFSKNKEIDIGEGETISSLKIVVIVRRPSRGWFTNLEADTEIIRALLSCPNIIKLETGSITSEEQILFASELKKITITPEENQLVRGFLNTLATPTPSQQTSTLETFTSEIYIQQKIFIEDSSKGKTVLNCNQFLLKKDPGKNVVTVVIRLSTGKYISIPLQLILENASGQLKWQIESSSLEGQTEVSIDLQDFKNCTLPVQLKVADSSRHQNTREEEIVLVKSILKGLCFAAHEVRIRVVKHYQQRRYRKNINSNSELGWYWFCKACSKLSTPPAEKFLNSDLLSTFQNEQVEVLRSGMQDRYLRRDRDTADSPTITAPTDLENGENHGRYGSYWFAIGGFEAGVKNALEKILPLAETEPQSSTDETDGPRALKDSKKILNEKILEFKKVLKEKERDEAFCNLLEEKIKALCYLNYQLLPEFFSPDSMLTVEEYFEKFNTRYGHTRLALNAGEKSSTAAVFDEVEQKLREHEQEVGTPFERKLASGFKIGKEIEELEFNLSSCTDNLKKSVMKGSLIKKRAELQELQPEELAKKLEEKIANTNARIDVLRREINTTEAKIFQLTFNMSQIETQIQELRSRQSEEYQEEKKSLLRHIETMDTNTVRQESSHQGPSKFQGDISFTATTSQQCHNEASVPPQPQVPLGDKIKAAEADRLCLMAEISKAAELIRQLQEKLLQPNQKLDRIQKEKEQIEQIVILLSRQHESYAEKPTRVQSRSDLRAQASTKEKTPKASKPIQPSQGQDERLEISNAMREEERRKEAYREAIQRTRQNLELEQSKSNLNEWERTLLRLAAEVNDDCWLAIESRSGRVPPVQQTQSEISFSEGKEYMKLSAAMLQSGPALFPSPRNAGKQPISTSRTSLAPNPQ